MLHACDQRFDVTGNLENFYELNKASANFELVSHYSFPCFSVRRQLLDRAANMHVIQVVSYYYS